MNKGSNLVDTPAMIQYCLRCPWDKCWNCLGQKSSYSYALRMELDGNEAALLAKQIMRNIRFHKLREETE